MSTEKFIERTLQRLVVTVSSDEVTSEQVGKGQAEQHTTHNGGPERAPAELHQYQR